MNSQIRNRKFQITLFVLLFIFASLNVYATNYYVSNNGNDDSTATSPAAAWKTISKVNSMTFQPGDSILFKCGDRWMEYLIIPSSGNSSDYITFSSYGTGAKPKLYGSVPITSFISHPTLSYVYKCDTEIVSNPYYGVGGYRASIWYKIDDSVIWGDGIDNYKPSLGDLASNYDWTWQNDSIYFYYDGSISDIDTIECPQLARGIDITQEYITIDGLDIRYTGNRCIGWMNWPEVTMHGCTIRNCHIAYSASNEEGVGYGIALGFSDMIVEKNDIHDNGRRNISINLVGSTGSAVMRNIIIQDNELHNGYHTTGVDLSIHSPNQVVKNIIIRRNHIYDPYNVNTGYHSEGVFLQNEASATLDSIFIYNNVIQNITLDGVWCYGVERVFIINNTFTGPAYSPHYGAFIYSADSTVRHTIMNNIFCNYGTESMTSFDGASNGKSILDTCDYNLYYTTNNYNSTYIWYQYDGHYYYYNQWEDIQALGYEEHGLNVQSVSFVDSIADLRLQSTSSAIGKGKHISFITTDIKGNPRDPDHPCIGAYEYQYPSNINEKKSSSVDNFILNKNYPNPFNPSTTISYTVRIQNIMPQHVNLSIYNTLGQKVATLVNNKQPAGNYQIKWNAKGLASGVYICTLKTSSGLEQSRKLILFK